MAYIMRILGRVAGRAVRSGVFDHVLTVAAGIVISEMKVVDLRARRTILRRKFTTHKHLLGRTVYRLMVNDIPPAQHGAVEQIIRVMDEIGTEIGMVDEELRRRRETGRTSGGGTT